MAILDWLKENVRIFHKVNNIPTDEDTKGFYYVWNEIYSGIYVVTEKTEESIKIKIVKKIFDSRDWYNTTIVDEKVRGINDQINIVNSQIEEINEELTKSSKFKGYFIFSDDLESAYPNPEQGAYAWVGTTYPGTIWMAMNRTWANSGLTPSTPTVDLANYAKTTTENGTVVRTADGTLPNDIATLEDIAQLDAKKQNILVSGSTIKTINGRPILGSGDITLSGSGDSISVADEIQVSFYDYDEMVLLLSGDITINQVNAVNINLLEIKAIDTPFSASIMLTNGVASGLNIVLVGGAYMLRATYINETDHYGNILLGITKSVSSEQSDRKTVSLAVNNGKAYFIPSEAMVIDSVNTYNIQQLNYGKDGGQLSVIDIFEGNSRQGLGIALSAKEMYFFQAYEKTLSTPAVVNLNLL